MAKKTLEQKIDALTSIVERGFGAVAEDIACIKRDMATKDDIADLATKDDVRNVVREETKDIRDELTSIRRDLDRLTANVENVIGYRKEIDYALERIAAIEKHLGIEKKIAA